MLALHVVHYPAHLKGHWHSATQPIGAFFASEEGKYYERGCHSTNSTAFIQLLDSAGEEFLEGRLVRFRSLESLSLFQEGEHDGLLTTERPVAPCWEACFRGNLNTRDWRRNRRSDLKACWCQRETLDTHTSHLEVRLSIHLTYSVLTYSYMNGQKSKE